MAKKTRFQTIPIMGVIRNSLSFKRLRDPVLYGFVHQKRLISANGLKSITTPLLILRLFMYKLALFIDWLRIG